MSTETDPPIARYRLTVEITGNSHDEIERELHYLTNGGYLQDSDGYKRDTFHVLGGRITTKLEHVNPEMTPERYDEELSEWWKQRRAARRA